MRVPRITRTVRRTAAGILLFLSLGMNDCEGAGIEITSPTHGAFVNEDSILVTGTTDADLTVHSVAVNGVPATIAEDDTWSATVELDRDAVFNNVVAHVIDAAGAVASKASLAVVVGDSVPSEALAPEAIAFRVNESALESLGTTVEDIIDLDLSDVLPVGTELLDQCFVRGLFGICIGRARVVVNNPPPEHGAFDVTFDPQAQEVATEVHLSNLRASFFIDGSGLVPNCTLDVSGADATITTRLALRPDASDPTRIDVAQIGNASLELDDLQHRFTGGLCAAPILGKVVQALMPNVQATAETGLRNFLNTRDASGNTPIAEAAELTLAGVDITGPLAASFDVDLMAPFFDIAEDEGGVTFGADLTLTPACTPPPGAPVLSASYSAPSRTPSFSATTPGAGAVYDVGVCISSAGFNQLLRAQTECGLLQADIERLDLGGGTVPLNVGLVAAFLPSLGGSNPERPLRIELQPTLAPVFTGQLGPNGEPAEVRIGYLLVRIVANDGTDFLFLEAAVSTTLGVDIDFDPIENALRFSLTVPASPQIEAILVENQTGASESEIQSILPLVFRVLLPTLEKSLDAFPVPKFEDFQLNVVEVGRNDEFVSVFGTLF